MANKRVPVSISCPSCKGRLNIREMECPVCNLTIRADFEQDSAATGSMVDRFRNLTNDEAYFLETFLRCRGIIRDVEAALGISYPTVRARLDGLLSALKLGDGLAAVGKFVQAPPIPAAQQTPPQSPEPPASPKQSAKDILSKLDSGQIDAKSALDALKD